MRGMGVETVTAWYSMYQEFIEIFEDDKTQSNIPNSYRRQCDTWVIPFRLSHVEI